MIDLEKLYLVRAMSLAEFKTLRQSADVVQFRAQTNEAKAAAGRYGAVSLVELGFCGPALASRNTIHFCLNALVRDHVNGKFSSEVIMFAPLGKNLEPSGPSSFQEVDVAFPYRDGVREFRDCTFQVREDLAHTAAEHITGTPDAPPIASSFAAAAGEGAVASFLESRGAPVKLAGWHAWADSGQNAAHQEKMADFVAQLSATCGHAVRIQAHAGTLENDLELALAKVVESSDELFRGQPLYQDDSGVDQRHSSRISQLALQVQMAQAAHPDTAAYARNLAKPLGSLAFRAREFHACWRRWYDGDAEQEARLYELAPEMYHEGLGVALDRDRPCVSSMPPPLDQMAPAG